jgi:hypothetical protein
VLSADEKILFMSDGFKGLSIFDVSNRNNPIEITSI